jgi:site-specific DNA recombinase
MVERPNVRRCAIYTRKSSDEGLDQAFNSLDAQRDACSAYIASQKHEGWVPIDKKYDDGGFSGGSLHRPALQELLEDMAKGLIDIIVVYKIDRLTRSLADFAKLTEVLDKHEVSFVAVTQQFNTSTSMGRLTLNVLLSFAQFEREVAGERIRDKIAASKRRGMWMGGVVPLGYDVKDRKLVINEQEAETVRYIFNQYLVLKSVQALKQHLDASGVRSKRHVRKDGTETGGNPFFRGALYTILNNPIYRGLISHKKQTFPGDHEAIIPEELFQSVQATLSNQGPGEAAKAKRTSPALLRSLVFDSKGNRLQPTHSSKHGRKYRYYVSAPMIRNAKSRPDGLRVPASDLEKMVINAITAKLRDKKWVTSTFAGADDASEISKIIERASSIAKEVEEQAVLNNGTFKAIINRVEVNKSTISIKLDLNNIAATLLQNADAEHFPLAKNNAFDLVVSGQFLRCGKQVRLVLGNDDADQREPDNRLIQEILRAQTWFDDLASGRAKSIAELARRSQFNVAHVSRRITLAFLAPKLVESILAGTQPLSLTVERLGKACPLPTSWDEQSSQLLA